jgi:hypothetical protein
MQDSVLALRLQLKLTASRHRACDQQQQQQHEPSNDTKAFDKDLHASALLASPGGFGLRG